MMENRKEFDLSVFGLGSGHHWRVVVWSWIENLQHEKGGNAILLQTIDRSQCWAFDDMGEAYKFCFDNGLVPVDEMGDWYGFGDLNAGMGEAEPVPLIAWRRYWKKDALVEEPEPHCPDWTD